MDFWQLLATIQDQFPQYIPILSKPGVFQVLADTINHGWSAEKRDAALAQTPYYLSTDLAHRQWDNLQATDPATASQKAEQVKRTMDDLQHSLGITLDNTGGLSSPAFSFFVNAVTEGWTPDEIKYRMLASVNSTVDGGAVASSAANVKQMANDYGVPLSDNTTMSYARQMTAGSMDQKALQGYLIEQAKSLFPALSTALDQGITVKQYVDPYIQLAQQNLGLNPSTVNLTDQKWMNLLNQVDPKTGQRVSMSLDQALSTMRTDPSWGYDQTSQARQSATQLAQQLGQKFGAT